MIKVKLRIHDQAVQDLYRSGLKISAFSIKGHVVSDK